MSKQLMLTFKIYMKSTEKHMEDYFQDFLTSLIAYEILSFFLVQSCKLKDVLIFFQRGV